MKPTTKKFVDDEELHAFVDGELPKAKMQSLQLEISESRELKAKHNNIVELKRNLREAFAEDATPLRQTGSGRQINEFEMGMPGGMSAAANEPRFPRLAAACLLVGTLAGAVGYNVFDSHISAEADYTASVHRTFSDQTWLVQMANYQEMYTFATLGHLNATEGPALDADLLRWSGVLDADMVVPHLNEEGVEFRRGQILQSKGEPVIQLTYMSKDGQPVAVCITPLRDDTQSANSVEQAGPNRFGELNYIHWRQNNLEIAVMAKLPHGKLRNVGQLVEKSFQSSDSV